MLRGVETVWDGGRDRPVFAAKFPQTLGCFGGIPTGQQLACVQRNLAHGGSVVVHPRHRERGVVHRLRQPHLIGGVVAVVLGGAVRGVDILRVALTGGVVQVGGVAKLAVGASDLPHVIKRGALGVASVDGVARATGRLRQVEARLSRWPLPPLLRTVATSESVDQRPEGAAHRPCRLTEPRCRGIALVAGAEEFRHPHSPVVLRTVLGQAIGRVFNQRGTGDTFVFPCRAMRVRRIRPLGCMGRHSLPHQADRSLRARIRGLLADRIGHGLRLLGRHALQRRRLRSNNLVRNLLPRSPQRLHRYVPRLHLNVPQQVGWRHEAVRVFCHYPLL